MNSHLTALVGASAPEVVPPPPEQPEDPGDPVVPPPPEQPEDPGDPVVVPEETENPPPANGPGRILWVTSCVLSDARSLTDFGLAEVVPHEPDTCIRRMASPTEIDLSYGEGGLLRVSGIGAREIHRFSDKSYVVGGTGSHILFLDAEGNLTRKHPLGYTIGYNHFGGMGIDGNDRFVIVYSEPSSWNPPAPPGAGPWGALSLKELVIKRYLRDGTLDTSFGEGGTARFPNPIGTSQIGAQALRNIGDVLVHKNGTIYINIIYQSFATYLMGGAPIGLTTWRVNPQGQKELATPGGWAGTYLAGYTQAGSSLDGGGLFYATSDWSSHTNSSDASVGVLSPEGTSLPETNRWSQWSEGPYPVGILEHIRDDTLERWMSEEGYRYQIGANYLLPKRLSWGELATRSGGVSRVALSGDCLYRIYSVGPPPNNGSGAVRKLTAVGFTGVGGPEVGIPMFCNAVILGN